MPQMEGTGEEEGTWYGHYLDGSGCEHLINKLKTLIAGKAPTSHASTGTTYGKATAANYGHIRLSDNAKGTAGLDDGYAATPSAVREAYTLANTAKTTADSKQDAVSNGTVSVGATGSAAVPADGKPHMLITNRGLYMVYRYTSGTSNGWITTLEADANTTASMGKTNFGLYNKATSGSLYWILL